MNCPLLFRKDLLLNSAISGLMTGQEIIKKNPAAERGANVVGCNWVLKIVNGKYTSVFEENDFYGVLILSR